MKSSKFPLLFQRIKNLFGDLISFRIWQLCSIRESGLVLFVLAGPERRLPCPPGPPPRPDLVQDEHQRVAGQGRGGHRQGRETRMEMNETLACMTDRQEGLRDYVAAFHCHD